MNNTHKLQSFRPMVTDGRKVKLPKAEPNPNRPPATYSNPSHEAIIQALLDMPDPKLKRRKA